MEKKDLGVIKVSQNSKRISKGKKVEEKLRIVQDDSSDDDLISVVKKQVFNQVQPLQFPVELPSRLNLLVSKIEPQPPVKCEVINLKTQQHSPPTLQVIPIPPLPPKLNTKPQPVTQLTHPPNYTVSKCGNYSRYLNTKGLLYLTDPKAVEIINSIKETQKAFKSLSDFE